MNKTKIESRLVVVGLIALVCATASVAHAVPVTSWADDIAGGNGTDDPLISSAGSNARIAGSYALQTLSNVGDKISLTGSFVLSGSVPDAHPAGVFRWGLYNVNGQATNSGWLGYLAQSDSANAVAGSDLVRKTNISSNYTTPGGTDTVLANVEQVAMPLAAGVPYAFELTATLLAGDQLQIDWIMSDGGSYNFSSSINDPTPSTLSFDRVGLFIGNQLNAAAQFTDVDVTTMQIPEPGTFVLLGAGLAGVALAYRRRRDNRATG